jgi:hypothetical protein
VDRRDVHQFSICREIGARFRFPRFPESTATLFTSTAESALAGIAALVPVGSAPAPCRKEHGPPESALIYDTYRHEQGARRRAGDRRGLTNLHASVVPIRHHSGKLSGCALVIATATSDTSLRARGATGSTALCQSADAGSTPAGSTLPFLWRSRSGRKYRDNLSK